jgi:hypothetical protein
VPTAVDDMETLSSGTDSFIVSPMASPKAPEQPRDPNNGSLRTLLAARRVAKVLGSSRRGGVANPRADVFPNQPTTSRFLAHAAHNVSPNPLQFVLDVGSEEVNPIATMEQCIQHVKRYLETCANSVDRQSERVQAVLGQLQTCDASASPNLLLRDSDVTVRVRQRVSSVSNLSLLPRRPSVSAVSARRAGGPQENNEKAPDETPAPELLYQIACELHALTPRRLPDFVLCYWDFTASGSLEESLASAFASLGAALDNSRTLIANTNKYLSSIAPTTSPIVLGEESIVLDDRGARDEFQVTRRVQQPAFREIPPPPLCMVTWKLQYCRLRGVSFAELPLSFAPPPSPQALPPTPLSYSSSPTWPPAAASSGGDANILQTSFRIGGMTIISPRAARQIQPNIGGRSIPDVMGVGTGVSDDTQQPISSFRLASLSVSHCAWRESSKYGLQHVLKSSGWGLEELELRGAYLTEELVGSIAGVILPGPLAVLSRVTLANCKGWSATDPTMQLLLMDALKASRCVKELVLQGVPIPPKAGIALLAAVQHNPIVDHVRLESCHFVTPKFLATLHGTLQNTERRSQPSPMRGRRGSMSTTGDGARRSSFASLLA